MTLAGEQPYSPEERPRDFAALFRYSRPRNRTPTGPAADQVGYVEQLLEHEADWSMPLTAEGESLAEDLGGSLLTELLLAASAARRNASLLIQLEVVAGRIAAASKEVAPTEQRSSRRVAGLQPETSPAPPPPLSAKQQGKLPAAEAEPSSGRKVAAKYTATTTPGAGRPLALAAAGHATRDGLRVVSALAHDAPRKARALFAEQQARPHTRARMLTCSSADPRVLAQMRTSTRLVATVRLGSHTDTRGRTASPRRI